MTVDYNNWFRTDPVTPNHVLVMSCTYEGFLNQREIFEYLGEDVQPVTQWLRDHDMDDRCRFDYRAYKDTLHNTIKVTLYVLFDCVEDMVIYKLCQDDILNDLIEGIM